MLLSNICFEITIKIVILLFGFLYLELVVFIYCVFNCHETFQETHAKHYFIVDSLHMDNVCDSVHTVFTNQELLPLTSKKCIQNNLKILNIKDVFLLKSSNSNNHSTLCYFYYKCIQCEKTYNKTSYIIQMEKIVIIYMWDYMNTLLWIYFTLFLALSIYVQKKILKAHIKPLETF